MSMPSPDALAITAAVVICALIYAFAVRMHTRTLVALADRERTDLGEALEIVDEEDWMRVVQQVVVETYGSAGEIVNFQHIAHGQVSWMSFLGRANTLYVLSTQPVSVPGAPGGRLLRGLAAAELSGQLNAVWRFFAGSAWRTSWLRRHQRWYVLVTTVDAQRAFATGSTSSPVLGGTRRTTA